MHNKGGNRHGRIDAIFLGMPPVTEGSILSGGPRVRQRVCWSKSGGKCFPAAVLEATPTLLNLAPHQGYGSILGRSLKGKWADAIYPR